MKQLELYVDKRDDRYLVVLRQPGYPDKPYEWTRQTLIGFGRGLGIDWLEPTDRKVQITVGDRVCTIYRRATDQNQFSVQSETRDVSGLDYDRMLSQVKDLLVGDGEPTWPVRVHIKALDH